MLADINSITSNLKLMLAIACNAEQRIYKEINKKRHDRNENKMQTIAQTDYSGTEELENLEVMTNYNSSIGKKARYLAKPGEKVVDFGAGIGTFSKKLSHECQFQTLCVEIDSCNQKRLQELGFDCVSHIEQLPTGINAFFSSNVLEHIDDDFQIVCAMHEKLEKNGCILIYVPAKMLLWSDLDEKVGHYRRYEKQELRSKIESAGFRVSTIHYADSLGFLAALITKMIGYNPNGGLGSKKSMWFYDRYVFPISKLLDQLGMKYLIGKNLVVIAEKK